MAKFRSPNWQLNENFSRQKEKASCIGDRIGRNFKPWIWTGFTIILFYKLARRVWFLPELYSS